MSSQSLPKVILGMAALSAFALAQGTPGTLFAPPAAPLGTVIPFRMLTPLPGVPYLFDFSTAGQSPGTPLSVGGPIVPLNLPLYFHGVLGASPAYASVFLGFDGFTDPLGDATARIAVPDLQSLVGITLDACFVTLAGSGPFGVGLIGNSVSFTIVGSLQSLPQGVSAPFVPPPPSGVATRYVSPTGNDANNGATPQSAWRQISHAASQATPGMIIEIADGSYAGPVMIVNKLGTAAAPIIFRASGSNAVIVGAGSTNNSNRNSIFIGDSSWITVHGLRAFSSNRAGVRISLSPHVTISGCVFGNHPVWGIFTDYADDLRLLGNECYGSVAEHGIYHSNSGDRAVIAGNFCHDNNASGIQINADPLFLSPINGYVPDGISFHCVVERNLCTNNGAAGGAAINLASVRESVIRNNVIINSLTLNSSGIALWDDGAGIVWGCKDNLVEHNTVAYSSGKGRYAITLLNGSTGNILRNNILQGGRRGGVAFVPDCLPGLVSDRNVFHSVDGWPIIVRDDANFQAYSLAQWQTLGFDPSSLSAAPAFFAPQTGDWSLAPGSPGRDSGSDFGVPRDFNGNSRPAQGVDIGAYER